MHMHIRTECDSKLAIKCYITQLRIHLAGYNTPSKPMRA